MSTEQFKQQHIEILMLAKKIVPLLNMNDVKKESTQILGYLKDLLKDLTIHLTLEDAILYPKMMRSSNSTVATTAKKYKDEMGGIAQVAMTYKAKWSTSKAISSNPGEFITETKGLFAAIQERIVREDKILYPMFDRLES